MADPGGELGVMVSRAVPKMPDDPKAFRRDVQKILRKQFQDIQTLFAMTTDCDQHEQLQRENEQL